MDWVLSRHSLVYVLYNLLEIGNPNLLKPGDHLLKATKVERENQSKLITQELP